MSQPTISWSSNVGSIDSSGNFTVQDTSGAGTVTATSGAIGGTAMVTVITQPPAFTSSDSTTFTTGALGSFAATASGYPAPTFIESGSLPSGVTFTSAGLLSGTPTVGTEGVYPIVFVATNGVSPDAIQSFTLTVDQAPAITSSSSTTFTAGASGSFSVTASGYPAPTFTESGTLPSGVTLTSAGVLSGTPAAGTGGTYSIDITATNDVSPEANQTFTLTVDQAPAITSSSSTTFTVGTSGSFSVTASGFPAPTFAESGSLPSGVTLTSAGVLSGTPAAGTGGTYSIGITATNGVSPDATQTFTLTVDQAPAFTSSSSTTFTVGTSGTFSVTASGYPAPTFTESGSLPSGVTLTSAGVLSGTPAAGTGGTYSIGITATNGVTPDANQTFTLTVDQAPAITSSSSTTFTVGASGTFLVTASGFPAPTFTESGSLPSGVTLTSAGVLSGTPAAGTGGTYSIEITATNGVSPDASQTFTLTVDQAPAFTSSSSTTFTVGTLGSFPVTASGYPAPTFAETGLLPSGVTLTSAGVLSGTPAAGTGGTYSIDITATNGVSPDASQTFTLTVDQAPAFTSSSSATFTTGTLGSFSVTASGYPDPTFTESGSLPSGVTLTSAGVLSGTPAAGTGGTYSIVITATNGVSPEANQTFTLTVDQAPAITSSSSTTFTTGTLGSFSVAASGYPDPTFTESGLLPSGVTLTSAGVLSGTPAAGTGGTYSIDITATNGVTPDANQTFTLTVDQAPAITSSSSTTFTTGTLGSFSVAASGYPDPTFTESGSLPSGVTLTSAGVLSGTPAAGTGGTYSIGITATNGVSPEANQTFTLTVDQAPAITSSSSTTFTVGTSGSFSVTASGFPAPTFAESGSLPSGVTLTSAGVLSGTPAAGTGGTYSIDITATNGVSPDANQTFTLTVDQAPAFTSSSSTTFTTGTLGSFSVAASGYPAPTFTESGSLPSGVTLTSAGVLSGTPAAGTGGTYSIVITATNGVSPDANQTFTLTVDQAPAFTSSSSTTFTVGESGTFPVTASGYPAPTFAESGSLPSGVTLTSAGVLSGTPAAGTGGTYSIDITATNGVSPDANQTFTLTVDQSPAFTSSSSTTFTVGASGTFLVTASGFPAPTFTESGSLPSGVTLTSAGMLSGTPAAGTGGTYSIVITATNGVSPDANQTFTLTVDQAPAFTSSSSTTFTVGASGTFPVTASGYPAPTFAESGSLPSGVTLTSAGVLSGTPAAGTGGTYSIDITATNGVSPDANQTFTLTVDQAPAFTSSSSTTFTAGTSGSFSATASGFPTPTFAESGSLPSGVTLTSAGVLSGTPAVGTDGAYSIVIVATNGTSPDATQTFTLTVDQAPAFTSSSSTTFTVGTSGTFPVTASGYPNPTFAESGSLPSGVTLTSAGVLSGTPAPGTAGIYSIDITATNGVSPDATQTFTLTVSQGISLVNSFVTVSSASVPAASTVTVPAGNTATITLQAVDVYGNALTVGGLTVGFAYSSPTGGQGTIPSTSVTDNQNGTYTAAFPDTSAGTYTITATINGSAVTSPSPTITVTPGTISPADSQMSVLLSSVQLGGETTIVLQGEDAFGNLETSGGANIAFELENSTGAQGTIGAVTDNNNGTYTATFLGTVGGSNAIDATIGGSPVASMAPISVTGAAVNLAYSTVTVSQATVQSGARIQVTLQAGSGKGVKETSGGLIVAFGLGKGSGQGTFGPVSYIGNGEYTSTFTGTLAGSNTITATINGSKVTSKAAPMKVTAGSSFSSANSLVTVSSASVKAGGKLTVTFQPVDAAGNKLNIKGLNVSFALSADSDAQGSFAKAIYNKNNGTYTATFLGTIVGGGAIATTVNGQTIASTPPVITVTPGKADAAKSTVTVTEGTIPVVSGSSITLTLQAVDANGNLETTGGLAVAFKLASAKGGLGNIGKVIDNENGTYTVTFTGTIAGTNTIEATIAGAKVAAPVAVTVTPGPYSLAKSVVTVSEPGSVGLGDTITVLLQTEDAAGNDLTTDLLTSGGTISFEVGNPIGGGQGTFLAATYLGNGEYEATFTGVAGGFNTIVALIDGSPVTSTAPTIEVT